jgi:6-phosphogluconolactonase
MNPLAQVHRHADMASLAEGLAAETARLLADALTLRRRASLVVPGGRTPAAWFQRLRDADLDWARVDVTLSDERWVDPLEAASNESLVRRELLQGRAASARFTGLKTPAATAADGAAGTWRQLETIARPFDLVALGMGEDGHFASLFPDDPASSAGLSPAQAPGCVAVLAPAEPRERLSMNLCALLQCRRLALLVTGDRKWMLLEQQLEGSASPLPVRALLRQQVAPLSIWWAP